MSNRMSAGHNISYKGNIKKQGYLPKIHIKKFSEQNKTMQKVPKVAKKIIDFVVKFLDTL